MYELAFSIASTEGVFSNSPFFLFKWTTGLEISLHLGCDKVEQAVSLQKYKRIVWLKCVYLLFENVFIFQL